MRRSLYSRRREILECEILVGNFLVAAVNVHLQFVHIFIDKNTIYILQYDMIFIAHHPKLYSQKVLS